MTYRKLEKDEWHRLKPLESLLTAVILAVVPYALLRGPINRLVRLFHAHGKQVQGRKA